MKVICKECKEEYRVDRDKLAGRSIRAKCLKCDYVISIQWQPVDEDSLSSDTSGKGLLLQFKSFLVPALFVISIVLSVSSALFPARDFQAYLAYGTCVAIMILLIVYGLSVIKNDSSQSVKGRAVGYDSIDVFAQPSLKFNSVLIVNNDMENKDLTDTERKLIKTLNPTHKIGTILNNSEYESLVAFEMLSSLVYRNYLSVK